MRQFSVGLSLAEKKSQREESIMTAKPGASVPGLAPKVVKTGRDAPSGSDKVPHKNGSSVITSGLKPTAQSTEYRIKKKNERTRMELGDDYDLGKRHPEMGYEDFPGSKSLKSPDRSVPIQPSKVNLISVLKTELARKDGSDIFWAELYKKKASLPHKEKPLRADHQTLKL